MRHPRAAILAILISLASVTFGRPIAAECLVAGHIRRLVEIDSAWKETRRVIAAVSLCVCVTGQLMDKAADAVPAVTALRAILNCRFGA